MTGPVRPCYTEIKCRSGGVTINADEHPTRAEILQVKSGVLQHDCLDRWSAAAEQKQVQKRAA